MSKRNGEHGDERGKGQVISVHLDRCRDFIMFLVPSPPPPE